MTLSPIVPGMAGGMRVIAPPDAPYRMGVASTPPHISRFEPHREDGPRLASLNAHRADIDIEGCQRTRLGIPYSNTYSFSATDVAEQTKTTSTARWPIRKTGKQRTSLARCMYSRHLNAIHIPNTTPARSTSPSQPPTSPQPPPAPSPSTPNSPPLSAAHSRSPHHPHPHPPPQNKASYK